MVEVYGGRCRHNMEGGTMADFIWCVACGGEIEPDEEGEYLYCEWCDDGPFCESCLNEHECDEEDDAWD